MLRAFVLVLTALVAVDHFAAGGDPAASTVTGHVLGSLTYALGPAALALAVAGSKWVFTRNREVFAKDFYWTWAFFVTVLAGTHIASGLKVMAG